MREKHKALRLLLGSILVFLLGAGYVLTSANAATSEAILNSPKINSPSASPTETQASEESAALTAINKAQETKGCNLNLIAETVAPKATPIA